MPLTRYEVRNEYSLANPDLYRAAAKDDPEGLLEGVAMAGLVGIVRQLGDLAEFAAEVFHDLHEEVLATASRGHELLIRIQQLEAELLFVEKLMLAETNYVNFVYNAGLEWHANIQNEQNHFTQGDLPRFIRNAYEDCRSPPRLFLLDKFDVAGAGACLKRYTDPSYFRMEWASSELMKAEKEQQDKKARRIKKKGRRQREIRDAFFVGHIQPRICPIHVEVENAATSSSYAQIPDSQRNTDLDGLLTVPRGHEQEPESSRLGKPERDGPNPKPSHDPSQMLGETSVDSSALSGHQFKKPNETLLDANSLSAEVNSIKAESPEKQKKILPMGANTSEDVADFASETDNYMDAMTTIDLEAETDLDAKTSYQVNKGLMSNHVDSNNAVNAKQVFPDHVENLCETDLVTESAIPSFQKTVEEDDTLEGGEPAHVSSSDASFIEEKKSSFVDGDLFSQKSGAYTPDSGSLPSTPALDKLTINSEELLESEIVDGIPETPRTPAARNHDTHQPETLSNYFHQVPESVDPTNSTTHNVFPEQNSAGPFNLGDKIMIQQSSDLFRPHSDKASFEDSQSDMSEVVRESSLHSSPDSSIQPMKWAMDFPRKPNIALDSDDELDVMQVSSPSSSSSNSALSSPRPSTLATTVFDNKPQSPPSPLVSSPESLGLTSADSPASSMAPGTSSSLLPGRIHGAYQNHVSSEQVGYNFLAEYTSSFPDSPIGEAENQEGALAEGLEHFPPPPPLPPLEWRMTRRFGGLMSSTNNVVDSSSRFPVPQKPLWRIRESPEAASLPPLPRRVQLQHDDVPYAHKPFSALQDVSQGLYMAHDVQEQLESKESYDSETEPVSFEAQERGFIEERTIFSGTAKETVQPDITFGLRTSISHDVSSTQGSEASPLIEHPSPEIIHLLQVDEPTHSVRSLSEGSPVSDKKDQDVADSLIRAEHILECCPNTNLKVPDTSVCLLVPDGSFKDDDHVNSSQTEKQIPAPPRPEQLSKDLRPPVPASLLENDTMLRPSIAPKIERKDSLIAAIASHDKSTLRKVPEWSQSSRTTRPDDREVLLEQIRTGSFSLRRTKTEKQEIPRPVTNINVAAILEKANAIRQAFVGSDDDDDDNWSDG